jgi:hypothetical protein
LPFTAGEDLGSGMTQGGCDTVVAPAGATAVGGGGESGKEVEAGVFARITNGRWYQGSWLVGFPQR